jgi:quercetin dioxygenase-like cupin family protein
MQILTYPAALSDQVKAVGKLHSSEEVDILTIQLKAGEQIPTHHAKELAIVIVKSGIVSFDVEGKEVVLSPNETLVMNPLENHSLVAIEDVELFVFKIK